MRIINCQQDQKIFSIAIVISRYNESITQLLLDGAMQRLYELKFSQQEVRVVWVPGAIEIPLVAARLLRTGRYEAVVCLGAVIRGETSHYDFVCQQVSHGCQQVALEQDKPVIFGILTTDNQAQALDRLGGKHGHKGRDAIDTACEMVALLQTLAHEQET